MVSGFFRKSESIFTFQKWTKKMSKFQIPKKLLEKKNEIRTTRGVPLFYPKNPLFPTRM